MKAAMNLKDILNENGLEIIKEIGMKYLRVKFTEEELNKKLKKKELYDYDLEGEFNVEVSEVGFTGEGGLYIILTCIDNEHFEEGSTFEIIEY